MAELVRVDSRHHTLVFGGTEVSLSGPFAELILKALLSMLPAEKMEMMRPTTTRAYTLTQISPADYEQLVATIAQINQDFGQEVLRTHFRARAEGEPLQAKILLGEKTLVKGVELAPSGANPQ
ncbi:MAG: hypothetical protein SNJ68_03770 [Cyanobacteriota bacterium]